MMTFLKRPSAKQAALLTLGLLFVFTLSVRPSNPFQTLTLRAEDFFFLNARHLKETPAEKEKMVLVALDDASFARINRKWPWDRAVYADLIEEISKQSPRLILLDVTFVGESKHPESDARLAEALRKAGKVLLPYSIGDDGVPAYPLDLFREASLDTGFVNKPLDIDFTIRQAEALRLKDGEILDFAYEVKAAAHLFGATPSYAESGSHIRFKKKEPEPSSFQGAKIPLPLRRDQTLFLNYQVRVRELETIPVWKVLSGEAPPSLFKDKIVLFGITNRIMHDIHNSPFGSVPGVFIVANFLLMILSGAYITEVGLWVNLLILFAIGLLTGVMTYRLPLWRGFLFLFYEVALLLGLAFFGYTRNLHWDFTSTVSGAILAYLGITFYKYLVLLLENVRLKEEAITDGLTGLYAYRYFELRLRNEFDRARRYNTPLSLVFIDIDHFKRINDTYGHEEGNVVLKTLAQILKKQTRRVDLVARYGGEEFCVVLPQTELEGARQYAEHLRKTVEETAIPLSPKTPLHITVSIGVSSYPRMNVSSGEALLKLTDSALYQAKQGGRNRVCAMST